MPTFTAHETVSGTHTLNDEHWLPRSINEVFDFFSDAYRLEEITPPWRHVHVLTPKPASMYPDSLIDYKLRLHGIPIGWRTEITEWEPPVRFVDCQLRGPDRLWRHWHTFEEQNGGTLVRDRVDYATPGGPLIHWLFVRPDLNRIFTDRRQRLLMLLGDSI